MKLSHIQPTTYTDGPGKRTAIFFQGCTIGCAGCQNRHLWPAEAGQAITPHELFVWVTEVADYHQGNPETLRITVTGGEPFQQDNQELAELLSLLKSIGAHIIVYTGYTFEALVRLAGHRPGLLRCLYSIDVLVDGKFESGQDSPLVQYRGSLNQRPIDLVSSLKTGQVELLDWNTPELIISEHGSIFGAIGLIESLFGTGEPTRRCGETEPVIERN